MKKPTKTDVIKAAAWVVVSGVCLLIVLCAWAVLALR